MRIKEWIGPVLAVLAPLVSGGIHMEMNQARVEAKVDSLIQRTERLERQQDEQRKYTSFDRHQAADSQWPE